jgi:hypothetical protein
MGFLRPSVDQTTLDCQRNPDIQNRTKANNLIEDIKSYQKNWLDYMEGVDKICFLKSALQLKSRG